MNYFVEFARESFGKIVGTLVVCVNFKDLELTTFDVTPEEMPFNMEILGL
jgi:hypothetical protein